MTFYFLLCSILHCEKFLLFSEIESFEESKRTVIWFLWKQGKSGSGTLTEMSEVY